ncbi:MAG: hypothetical protein AAGI38_23510 [Bacteroidota bacterium]
MAQKNVFWPKLPADQMKINCPHCLQENELAVGQRCQHCKMLMRSDAEQALLEREILPKVKSLKVFVASEGSSEEVSPAYAAELGRQLVPHVDRFPLLSELLEQVEKQLGPFQQRQAQFQRGLRLHLLILFVLILAPIGMLVLKGDAMVVGLLCLPVLGWGYIGIYAYWKKHKE